jgi:hypothetical protein
MKILQLTTRLMLAADQPPTQCLSGRTALMEKRRLRRIGMVAVPLPGKRRLLVLEMISFEVRERLVSGQGPRRLLPLLLILDAV